MNSIERLEHLLQLLTIEREEDLKQYRQNVLERSLKERCEKGVSWYPVELKHMRIGLGDRIILEVNRTQHMEKPQSLQSGSTVSVFGMQGNDEVGQVTGVAAAVQKDKMKIMLSTEHIPDWLPDSKLGINLEFDDKTYKEMNAAIRQVIEPKKNERLAELREVLTGPNTPVFSAWETVYHNPDLNDSQNRAVIRALEAHEVALIHGPPGTGKTTTLVQAIKETLTREHQVLICAPSNTAVDLLASKCDEQGLSVVRMGNPARVDESMQKLTLDGRMSEHEDYRSLRKLRQEAEKIRKQALRYKRNFTGQDRRRRKELLEEARELKSHAKKLEDYILHQILNRSQVVAATLIGSAHSLLQRKRFHTVFIDEAAQALEPACWIPLMRADRVILAGDHFQLPPTVKSFEAEKKGLGHTLFEYIMEQKPEASVMLEQQYRMHYQIMGFSAQQFYAGKLQADPSVRYRGLSGDIPPVEFVDTAGCGFTEKRNPETLSTANPEEGQLLMRHLATLLNQLEADKPELFEQGLTIGIIAPYREQVRTLRELLRNSPMLLSYQERITVHTVDGFQGQERDIMYISLTRSNDRGEIGFLKNTRRMNVALTRAKKKLVVIGDSATLGDHPFYRAFLDYVDTIDAYHSAWEWAGEG